MFLVGLVQKEMSFFFSKRMYNNKRVIKIAAKREVKIPINSVVANPLTGPDPKKRSMTAVIPVVMFASKMAESAPLIL